jgi:branched-chain amino acid transport system ATP-binding protein
MLRLEQVQAGYGRVPVLHKVDLAVPDGSTVALLGANGAGKTTLLKVAVGLLRPTSGRVVLDDEVINSSRTFRRARMGLCLIPEGRGIFRQLTVKENIAMFVSGRDLAGAVERATDAFPILGERLGQVAGTLSGGQQQILALTRALLSDARIVLADELSMGLAPVIVDEIFEALEALRRQGRSLLLVEQYVDRALAVAEYVYILHKGHVAFVGEPTQCEDHEIFERYMGSVA